MECSRDLSRGRPDFSFTCAGSTEFPGCQLDSPLRRKMAVSLKVQQYCTGSCALQRTRAAWLQAISTAEIREPKQSAPCPKRAERLCVLWVRQRVRCVPRTR